MGEFLLSIASPELLSWTGFVILAIALVGEAAVCIIPIKWETFHREAAFAFAILAAAGYAVERVGDDAIIDTLKTRAVAAETVASDAKTRAAHAELELAKINEPRKMTNAQMHNFVATLRAYKDKGFWVMVQKSVSSKYGEQIDFGNQLREAFAQADWKRTAHTDKNSATDSPEFTDVANRGCSVTSEMQPLAQAVSDGLKEAGIDCPAVADPSLVPDLVFVEVGL